MYARSRAIALLLPLLGAANAWAETPADEEVGIPDVINSDADAGDTTSADVVVDAVADTDPVDAVVDTGTVDVDPDVDESELRDAEGSADALTDVVVTDTGSNVDVVPSDIDDTDVDDTDVGADASAGDVADVLADAEADVQVDAPDPTDGSGETDAGADIETDAADGLETDAVADGSGVVEIGPLDFAFQTSVQLRGGSAPGTLVTVALTGPVTAEAEGSAGELLEILDLASGEYEAEWEASGYAPAAASISVPSAQVYPVVLYPAGTFGLAGSVLVDGAAVGGVSLELTGLSTGLRSADPLATASLDDGSFLFGEVAAGLYRLEARSGEYVARLDRVEILQDSTVNLRLNDETLFPPVETDSGCAASPAGRSAWPIPASVVALLLVARRRRRASGERAIS
jgi:hypothetical protein